MKRIIIGVLLGVLLCGVSVFATGDADIITSEQSNSIEYDEIQNAIDDSLSGDMQFDFKAIVGQLINGEYELDGRTFLVIISKELFKDLKSNLNIMIQILIISIGGAFLKNFSNSFDNKQVNEVAFFLIFLVIISLIIQSYHLLNNIAYDIISKLLIFVEALVPSLMSVIVLSGATISSVMIGEATLMAIGIIDNVIKVFLLPTLYIIVIFVVLNTLTDEGYLSKMVALLKKGYEWSIKIILWVFIGIFGLQSFGLPVVDGIVSKTAKQTVGIVPVVGTSLAQVSDIVVGFGSIIKNAFGIGAIIGIILLTVIPIMKIAVVAIIYKLSSAIVEPISDKRIATCLSDVGDLCFLLLGTVVLVVFMFILAITITLYLTNILLYIR